MEMAPIDKQKLAIAGAATLVSEPVLALAHTGGVGVICGLAVGLGAYLLTPSSPDEPKVVSSKIDTLDKSSLFYRMLNGKSVRSSHEDEDTENGDKAQVKDERENTVERVRQNAQSDMQDDLPQPPSTRGGKFVFSSILKSGFEPGLDNVYLATTTEGQHIYGTAAGLCHVALAGSTGGGKSSLMRLLMAQLCKAGAQVLLLNPHYTRYDIESNEDWTPFEPYLVYDPMECRKYNVIAHYLKYTAETLLPKRLERYANSLPTGKPYYLVLDELPSIIKHVPDAPSYLGELLREGRKVGIYIIAASQDFLAKTIAPDGSGGAVRDCYRTAYYVGGDATTGRVLLDMESKKIPEDQLGKGVVMLRCATVSAVKKAVPVRVPYVDNKAIYQLLGPSTYKPVHVVPEEELNLPPMDNLTQSEQQPRRETTVDDIMALLAQLPDIDPEDARYQDVQDRIVQFKQRTNGATALSMPDLPMRQVQPMHKPSTRLSPELQQAYDAYHDGYTNCRDMAAEIGVGKTKAAELIRQLKARHLIDG